MSDGTVGKLTAVLELRDNLSAKIKNVSKGLNAAKVATDKADASIKGVERSMGSAEKSALSMAKGVDKAKDSLQGIKGSYNATVGVRDNATGKARSIKSNLEGIQGKIYTATVNIRQNGAEKLKGLKSSMSSMAGGILGTSLQMAAGAGIGFGVYNAIKGYMDFEQEMSKVGALSGATGKEFDALTAKAQQMGATTMFTAKQSAEALSYMGMAGWNTQQMLDGIDGVMNLAAASGEELGRVSDIVTDALTAFGLKASDAGHFSDVLAKASSKSNTNVSMMGMTFKYVAPLAGALKYSVEDVATSIGLMANAGIKGEQAGTSLRAVMTRLVAPPKEAANAMTQLGLNVKRADGTMKPWMETMKDLRKAFAGLSDADKTKYASMLAGQEAMSGFLAIVNATETDFQSLTKEIRNADGAAKKMADQRMDNLAGDLTYLSSAWDGLTQKLMSSSGAGGGLRSLTQDIKGLVDTFTKGLDKGFGTAVFDTLIQSVTKLKNSFLELDGVGSILSGGALAFGLYKIVNLLQRAYGGVRNLLGAGGLTTSTAGGVGTTTGAMNVSANTVYVNGKNAVAGVGGAGAAGGGVAGGAAKTAGKFSRFAGVAKVGGIGLALSALDIYSNRTLAEGRQEEAQYRMASALENYEAVLKDENASVESLKKAYSERIAAQKYQRDVDNLNRTTLAETYGGAIGGALGAAIGTIAGPFGTVAGGIIGEIAGRKIGGYLTRNAMDGYNDNSAFNNNLLSKIKGNEDLAPKKADYFAMDGGDNHYNFGLSNSANAEQQANADTFGVNTDLSQAKLHAGYDMWAENAKNLKEKQQEIMDGVDETNTYMVSAFENGQQGVMNAWNGTPGEFQSNVFNPLQEGSNVTNSSMTSDFQKSSEETKSAWGGVGSFFDSLLEGIKQRAASCAASIANSMADAAASLRAGGHTTLAGAVDWIGNNAAWIGGTSYKKKGFASGTSFAPGGITEINEHGGEIVDLPTGSRVYPHATTMKMLSDAIASPSQSNSNTANITISGNAFTVREEADIDKIAYQILQLVQGAQANYNPI